MNRADTEGGKQKGERRGKLVCVYSAKIKMNYPNGIIDDGTLKSKHNED